jgi:RND family efflux transporter MFP subunit
MIMKITTHSSTQPVILSEAKDLRRFRSGKSEILRFAQNDIPILAVATIVTLLTACGHKKPAAPADLPAVKVQTIEIQAQTIPATYTAVGTVRPKLAANITAKVMAGIEQIPIKLGDTVRAGDVLAQLDSRDLRAQFERAKADFDRYQTLLNQGAATRAEFDAIQAGFLIAKANLSYATITAPFDGVVAQKFCDPGDMAAPGKPLFVIEQPTTFRLEASVPDRFNKAVAIGQKIAVTIGNTTQTGAVGEINTVADPASRSFIVKIDLPDTAGLKSGLFGRAEVPVGERTGLFVPAGAIRERGQLTFVYVVSNGRAQMRLVRPGAENEILAGLQAGEKIVVQGEVADGQRVEAQ